MTSNASYHAFVPTMAINNAANDSFPQLSKRKQTELTAWMTVTLCVSFTGACFNVLALYAAVPKKGVKLGLAILLYHFLSINLFMCLIAVPSSVFITIAKQHGQRIPPDTCLYFLALYSTVANVVKWSDAGLALNRCIALYYPHSYKAWTTRTATLGVILCAWIPSAVSQVPLSFGVGGTVKLQSMGQCASVPSGRLGVFLQVGLGTGLPLALTGTGCLLMVIKIFMMGQSKGHVVAPLNRNEKQKVTRLQHHVKMAKVLLLNFLWTAVQTIPWAVVSGSYPTFFTDNPVSALWFRAVFISQHGLTPVSDKSFENEGKWVDHTGYHFSVSCCWETKISVRGLHTLLVAVGKIQSQAVIDVGLQCATGLNNNLSCYWKAFHNISPCTDVQK
ncbi:hypothetical protein BV898_08241 [Hypsibius exemplaris]|uniref:G-protein coupled receptors family 1 profile domain-containing protein n=1 Tax=Hypsibius exemplaris TaxID=2072580 RepID=A0A1W0WQY3_HYPEX|nr:hypothetical protein BV898_08241 [Hypsibius exemplaris]